MLPKVGKTLQIFNQFLHYVWNRWLVLINKLFLWVGIASFWRGNVASIARYLPNQALNFSFKDSLREVFLSSPSSSSSSSSSYDHNTIAYLKFVVGNLLAGGFAGAGALTCTYPLDLARTRLAADVGKMI